MEIILTKVSNYYLFKMAKMSTLVVCGALYTTNISPTLKSPVISALEKAALYFTSDRLPNHIEIT